MTDIRVLPRFRHPWLAVEWILFAIWLADAALVMTHQRAGGFTDHAADLSMPAWIYLVTRRLRGTRPGWWRRWLVELPPATLALLIFAASAATEVTQLFWPRGLFRGVFDPLDILAYGAGIGLCWLADHRWPIPPRIPDPPRRA